MVANSVNERKTFCNYVTGFREVSKQNQIFSSYDISFLIGSGFDRISDEGLFDAEFDF